jgi:hypothetical protein
MAQATAASPLDGIVRWLDELEASAAPRTTGSWPLASVLDHLAQSVEMSMDGFPQPRSALFQRTLGRTAFGVFRRKGRMRHGLDQPIPSAPPVRSDGDWRAAAQRLRAAITSFQQHRGELRPHFAYGALSKDEYALAHALHIENHQDEIVTG